MRGRKRTEEAEREGGAPSKCVPLSFPLYAQSSSQLTHPPFLLSPSYFLQPPPPPTASLSPRLPGEGGREGGWGWERRRRLPSLPPPSSACPPTPGQRNNKTSWENRRGGGGGPFLLDRKTFLSFPRSSSLLRAGKRRGREEGRRNTCATASERRGAKWG